MIADPRAQNYAFMYNPLPTLGMVATYLTWVLIIGPIYMRDRKPMDIKNLIIYYNAFQVALSAYMFYEVSVLNLTPKLIVSSCSFGQPITSFLL